MNINIVLRVRDASLGGNRNLEIEYHPSANDCINISMPPYPERPEHAPRLSLPLECIPAVIATLQSVLEVDKARR